MDEQSLKMNNCYHFRRCLQTTRVWNLVKQTSFVSLWSVLFCARTNLPVGCSCMVWGGEAPSGICIETKERAARKLSGQAAAADWKLLDQCVGFWWCAVCSSGGTHLTRQVGTNSHWVVPSLPLFSFLFKLPPLETSRYSSALSVVLQLDKGDYPENLTRQVGTNSHWVVPSQPVLFLFVF